LQAAVAVEVELPVAVALVVIAHRFLENYLVADQALNLRSC
jgi:hypothetical protein